MEEADEAVAIEDDMTVDKLDVIAGVEPDDVAVDEPDAVASI